jgi:hypothetical protein
MYRKVVTHPSPTELHTQPPFFLSPGVQIEVVSGVEVQAKDLDSNEDHDFNEKLRSMNLSLIPCLHRMLGMTVDKDTVINYHLVISYRLSTRILTNQLTVDKSNRLINQLLIAGSLWMTVDKIWKLTNVVRFRLAPRSSHSQRQATFPDNVCSYSPPVTVCHVMKI